MKLAPPKRAALLLCISLVTLLLLETSTAHEMVQTPPTPIVVFMGREYYEANGKQWTRYRYDVVNRADFDNALFAPAPKLPPCGTNTNSSRAWVDIYDLGGKRLYGFCALGNRDNLAKLWFAMESDVIPPSWVRIVITDRQANTKSQSAPVETIE